MTAKVAGTGSAGTARRGTPRSASARFLVRLAAYMIACVVLLDLPPVDAWLIQPWTRLNATASAALTSLIGVPTTATGTVVRSATATLNIEEGCNGAHALLILLASVFAFPAPWRKRLVAAAVGTVAMLGFNLVRLVNLIVVARYFPSHLELFHVFIWQTLIILIAFAVFLFWVTLFVERPINAPAPPTPG